MSDVKIDKTKTALVVIDLQKGVVSALTLPYEAAAVVANSAKLAEMFRKNQMPVFLVRVTPSVDMKDTLHPSADIERQWNNRTNPDWSEIVPELGPQQGDFVITKRQWGAFYGTELDLQLRRRGIDTIVLCGISTNIGVESTARFAYEYGYNQIFIEDAMAARSKEEHENTIKAIFPRIGKVQKTNDLLDIL
jgi:nicotinamidase-related amidase